MGFHEQAGADGFREGCLMGFVGGRGQCQTARSTWKEIMRTTTTTTMMMMMISIVGLKAAGGRVLLLVLDMDI